MRNKILICSLLIVNIFALLLVFTPLTNYLYSFLEVKDEIKKADALIVFAAGSYTNELLDREGYQRLFHAFKLYEEKCSNKIIICGGSARKDLLPRSEIMKNTLVHMGVDKNNIIIERESQNTYENIRNIVALLEELGIKDSLLVTSASHMYRSLAVARKLGVNAYPAPVPCYEKYISRPLRRYEFVVDVLREYGAIAYYRLKGWI